MPLDDIVFEEADIRLSPAEAYKRLRRGSEQSFLLESAVGSTRTVSYSFLGASPREVHRDYGEDKDLAKLRGVMSRRGRDASPFPFSGGLVGYFSYDIVNSLEEGIEASGGEFPLYELGLFDCGLIYDHSAFKVYHYHPADEEGCLDSLVSAQGDEECEPFTISPEAVRTSQEEYRDGVDSLRSRIMEGEAFQTVLSQYEERRYQGDPFHLYERMRQINPSPYMFYLDFGERKVMGSSPETLVTVRGREMVTYPIAGTRPLGGDATQRRSNRLDLLADEKEKAEHIMLVDLARNDIGKVCDYGSVEVTDFMRVEEFSHVQHMVSKVRGSLRSDKDCVDALAAVFPAGTVTGAPKHRAMQLIEMNETRGRGPYAGAVGYISDDGDMDTAITIRSAFIVGDRVYFQAGAGIVMDSVPEREHAECMHKMKALHDAAGLDQGDRT